MDNFHDQWVMRDTFEDLLGTTTRLRGFLGKLNGVRIDECASCPICHTYPEIDEDKHADDCELAEELK